MIKMKKFLVIVFVFTIILIACDPNKEEEESELVYKSFYAQNFTNNSYYKLDAALLAEGEYCNVWVERGSKVTADTAKNIANIYDNNIYGKMINTFGIMIRDEEDDRLYNTMQLADALADNDGKLCILLLDIKDGYTKDGAYVAGYFWAGNFFSKDTFAYSNECDMIYVDTNPGVPGEETSNSTLAHEMQHLMNFITSVVVRSYQVGDYTYLDLMDTWVDEGLSSAAEWLYRGRHLEEHIYWYNENVSGSLTGMIKEGNNFFVWGNHGESQLAILDDYATVYMFFQWLRLQSNSSVYRNIISSSFYDYRSVTNALNTLAAEDYNTWNTVLKNWLAANYLKENTGPYGYKGDPVFAELKAPYAPPETSIQLAPGEGVYSLIPSGYSSFPSAAGNIKYAYISDAGTVQEDTISNGTLLTYNANTDNNSETEEGTTTGVAPAANIAENNARHPAPYAGPYRISANDMLKRNGLKEKAPVFKILEILRMHTGD